MRGSADSVRAASRAAPAGLWASALLLAVLAGPAQAAAPAPSAP